MSTCCKKPCRVIAPFFNIYLLIERNGRISITTLQVGACVNLRAVPTREDPRSQWPAVVRQLAFSRSGQPIFFVCWLDPIGRDPQFELPAKKVPLYVPFIGRFLIVSDLLLTSMCSGRVLLACLSGCI